MIRVKAGDRVRALEDWTGWFRKGDEAEVLAEWNDPSGQQVFRLRGTLMDHEGGFTEEFPKGRRRFELVAPEPRFRPGDRVRHRFSGGGERIVVDFDPGRGPSDHLLLRCCSTGTEFWNDSEYYDLVPILCECCGQPIPT